MLQILNMQLFATFVLLVKYLNGVGMVEVVVVFRVRLYVPGKYGETKTENYYGHYIF